jgi:hypothetical protein
MDCFLLDTSYSTVLSVSIVSDECEAVGGMRIGMGNESIRGKPAQRHFERHKSHMT